jgi:hypothetical protein
LFLLPRLLFSTKKEEISAAALLEETDCSAGLHAAFGVAAVVIVSVRGGKKKKKHPGFGGK